MTEAVTPGTLRTCAPMKIATVEGDHEGTLVVDSCPIAFRCLMSLIWSEELTSLKARSRLVEIRKVTRPIPN